MILYNIYVRSNIQYNIKQMKGSCLFYKEINYQ